MIRSVLPENNLAVVSKKDQMKEQAERPVARLLQFSKQAQET